jgi:hypothetical protein
MASDGGLISYGPMCSTSFRCEAHMQMLYEVTVAALMALGGPQIRERIVVECSIRYAERTMMTPRVGFGSEELWSRLDRCTARSCARSGRRNGARLRPLMIENRAGY